MMALMVVGSLLFTNADNHLILLFIGKMIDLLEQGAVDVAFTVTDATIAACAKVCCI